MAGETPPPLAVVLKGYPRLSETFIAQELKALQDRGLSFEIWSLRHPTDAATHPVHAEITAPVRYLPEYLHDAPLRVLRGLMAALATPGFLRAARVWLRDLARDPSLNRIRRFGQACVLATEAGREVRFFYAHFLHTPGSVTRYAALMRRQGWGFSAHARDIWTIPGWEKREKLADARFGVTCTAAGLAHLRALAAAPERLALLYHGLDLSRFPAPPEARPARDGGDARDPVRLLSVGRLVEKKGYAVLLDALADLPAALNWRFIHIGGGPLKAALKARAAKLGLDARIEWRGASAQGAVIAALREADLFVLPSRAAADGDRDGLPNVLMEAASQNLAIVSTRFSAIPEFIAHGKGGLLVKPGDAAALSAAILRLMRSPAERAAMAEAARARLVADFGARAGADAIAARLRAELDAARPRGDGGAVMPLRRSGDAAAQDDAAPR